MPLSSTANNQTSFRTSKDARLLLVAPPHLKLDDSLRNIFLESPGLAISGHFYYLLFECPD